MSNSGPDAENAETPPVLSRLSPSVTRVLHTMAELELKADINTTDDTKPTDPLWAPGQPAPVSEHHTQVPMGICVQILTGGMHATKHLCTRGRVHVWELMQGNEHP